VEYDFERTSDGLVKVVLKDDLPLLRHALEDSIDSRPPRGAPQDGPSTYWIDNALRDLRARQADASTEPFASGNVTYLYARGESVEARYDFDSPDSNSVDRVAVSEFIALLTEWRQRVLAESPDADRRVPPSRAARPMPPPA
jgi:hypothetical protein